MCMHVLYYDIVSEMVIQFKLKRESSEVFVIILLNDEVIQNHQEIETYTICCKWEWLKQFNKSLSGKTPIGIQRLVSNLREMLYN